MSVQLQASAARCYHCQKRHHLTVLEMQPYHLKTFHQLSCFGPVGGERKRERKKEKNKLKEGGGGEERVHDPILIIIIFYH